MAEGKYDYLKTTDILRDTVYPPFINMLFFALKDAEDFQIRFTHISVPFEGLEPAHSHDFDQIMLWVPCTDDLTAYDGETELHLGGEEEPYIINKTTALYVPAGLLHCPIRHTRIGTPFFFVNVPLAHDYSVMIDGKQAGHYELKLIPQDKPE